MKILTISQEKVVTADKDASGNPVAPKASPQFKFFQNIKKDIGIVWTDVKSYKVTHTIDGNEPAQLYEKIILGSRKGSSIKQPDFAVSIRVICKSGDQGVKEDKATIVLKSYATNTLINQWVLANSMFGTHDNMLFAINGVLQDELGLSGRNIETPSQFYSRLNTEETSLTPMDIHGKEGYYYHRLTRSKTNAYPSSVLELFIIKHKFGYTPMYSATHLELEKSSGDRAIGSAMPLGDAVSLIDKSLKAARSQKKYVGPESPLYIPEGANKDNWDFVLHQWKAKSIQQPENKIIPQQSEPFSQTEPSIPESQEQVEDIPHEPVDIPFKKPVLDLKKLFGQQQDFEGYFQGDVPDVAGDLVGSPSVDYSQISGMFGGANEAVSLVNNYTSDALKNVAYIFNFSKGGAYGVYIPALDRAIKTKALKRQLEQKGYKIVDENGVLTAHPTEEGVSPEQIDEDIESLWKQLNSSGGSALGINMSDVLSATQENSSNIMNKMRQEVPEVPPTVEEILKDVLGVYHLAAIILHEASHAKGGDEGKAQSDEQGFRSWAQRYLNQQYQSKLSSAGLEEYYSPLELGTEVLHAVTKSWYRTAQGIMGRLNYAPSSGGAPAPTGSDISGRYKGAWQSGGFAEWAMLSQQDQSIPIEQRLNRSQMAKLEPDVSQEHDIIEEQLRKQFKNDSKPNVQLITEELLSPDRDESQGYKTLEVMLEEQRPTPLMIPLEKTASSDVMIRTARYNSLFGWYNNLDISNGSTIPGLGDRVMAWDDRDESFAGEEDWIKSQERYNPEYDLKGFYYRWIEPRFKPQLFDDMTQDYSNTHPAKRFAAKLDPDLSQMLSIIKLIEQEIINEKIKATRIVVSEDLMDMVKRLLDQEGLKIRAYKQFGAEDIFAVWIYGLRVSESSLDKAEQYFQNVEGANQYEDLVEDLLGGRSIVTNAVEEIVNTTKELCKKYDIEDLYIIGEYARKIYEGEATPLASELNFTCESTDAGLKMGSILSNKLKVPNDFVILGDMGIIFPYKGVRVYFSKSPYLPEIGEKMEERGYNCEDPVLRDLCNRDFTINMMAYDVREMKVIDPIGVKSDIKNKIAKTLFCPSFIIEVNPMVIMRGIALKLDGYELDENLERSMIEGATQLSSGRFSPQRLRFTREYLKSKGNNDIESMFGEYGLNLCEEQEM